MTCDGAADTTVGSKPRQLLESSQEEEGDRFQLPELVAGCRDLLPKGMDS